MVAQKKEEAATTVVPAVTSEFDNALLMAAYNGDLAEVEALIARALMRRRWTRMMGGPRCTMWRCGATPRSSTR